MHPSSLLSPRRLDLVCKYLYFRELLSTAGVGEPEDSWAVQLYRKHVAARTGGIEPPDPFSQGPDEPPKVSVADYVRQAQALLSSLQHRGFDPAAPVTYFRDGTLGNGAHRIAAALALDIPLAARLHEGEGTAWGFNWFVEHGFTTEELQHILYGYAQLKADRVTAFVLYPPARSQWDAFTDAIRSAFHLVGWVDLALDSALAMYELVHDVYGTLEPLSSTGVINRKALLLAMAHPPAVRVVLAECKDGDDVYGVSTTVKNACRELARDIVPPGSYLTAHAGSSRAETMNLCRVLLSPNNIRQLHRRRAAGARAELLGWLGECRAACGRAGIALEDICVVGSSPLEVVGVRPSTDIDFTLKASYRKASYGSGVTHLAPHVDIVTEGYHRSRSGRTIPDEELIDNPEHHFTFRGFTFANPEIVLDQKAFYRREKDVRDLTLAAAVLGTETAVPFDPSFEFAARCEALIRELGGSRGPASDRSSRGLLRSGFSRVRNRVARLWRPSR